MTVDQIIEGILLREGPGDPAKGYLYKHDAGGRTNWGISERAHPEEWANGKVPSRERAAEIYRDEYLLPWAWVKNEPLNTQLVDCSVLHGYTRAVKLLQRTFGTEVDGVVGPKTRLFYGASMEKVGANPRHVNNALVAFRLKLIDEISDADVKQKAFEEGWEGRALSFLLLN